MLGVYHCDYRGYHKDWNPDYINHLKNPGKKTEMDLVEDFIEAYETVKLGLQEFADKLKNPIMYRSGGQRGKRNCCIRINRDVDNAKEPSRFSTYSALCNTIDKVLSDNFTASRHREALCYHSHRGTAKYFRRYPKNLCPKT